MDWKEGFVHRVLSAVPGGSYRRRMEAELRDHLETQCRALTEAGWPETEAQTEALRLMGEPEKLQKEYEAAWRRSPQAGAGRTAARFGIITGGCVLMGVLYCTIAILLLIFSRLLGESSLFLMAGIEQDVPNQIFCIIFMFLFLVPASFVGLYLHFCVRRERHPVRVVTAGLLTPWLGGRAAILLMCMADTGLPLGPELLERLPNYSFFLIFSPSYMVATFVGCILLGQFFGRFIERDEVETAQRNLSAF